MIREGQLAEDEPIRRMFPNGWYMICPAGVDLVQLHQAAGQFDAKFYGQDDPWFLKSYGEWAQDGTGSEVERILTEEVEIFIPDPTDWLLPGSKKTPRVRTIEMMNEFGATLPAGWTCPVPSGEELTLAVFEYHRCTGDYPLNGWNYALCRNRYESQGWLGGGGIGTDGFSLRYWFAFGNGSLGGLRWAVRYTKVGQKPT